jgi:hypothetical protein
MDAKLIEALMALHAEIEALTDKFLALGYDADDIANALHYRADQISPPISELNTLI